MKLIKLSAQLLGVVALIFGASSCNKDDDAGIECCTFTATYDSYTITGKACEDGTYTYTYDGTTTSGNWEDDYDSWAEVKAELISDYGATCS